jgi:hypothetical protein
VPNSLPTITIASDPVWNRLLAAFGNDPAQYRTWLRAALKAEVLRREAEAIQVESNAAQATQLAEAQALLETEWPTAPLPGATGPPA